MFTRELQQRVELLCSLESIDIRPRTRKSTLSQPALKTTVRRPIICSFCGITVLRFTFYTQNDENGNFISMASVFYQNLITDSDFAPFLKLDC